MMQNNPIQMDHHQFLFPLNNYTPTSPSLGNVSIDFRSLTSSSSSTSNDFQRRRQSSSNNSSNSNTEPPFFQQLNNASNDTNNNNFISKSQGVTVANSKRGEVPGTSRKADNRNINNIAEEQHVYKKQKVGNTTLAQKIQEVQTYANEFVTSLEGQLAQQHEEIVQLKTRNRDMKQKVDDAENQKKLFSEEISKLKGEHQGLVDLPLKEAEELLMDLKKAIVNVEQSLVQKRKQSETDKKCCVCMDQEKCFALFPCGHLALCEKCSKLVRKTCPICRQEIVTVHKIFA